MSRTRPSVRKREREHQKRERDRKKAEKALLKRERRFNRDKQLVLASTDAEADERGSSDETAEPRE